MRHYLEWFSGELRLLAVSLGTLCLLMGCDAAVDRAASTPVKPAASIPPRNESDDFFANGSVPRIRLQISESQEKGLREDPRRYVRCELIDGEGATLQDVGLKLKGAAGSFQELDGKPAFTLNANKFRKGQMFHRLDKFYLNNSVQDESYACEWLCSLLCRELGIPAPRITHARVWFNNRDLGLYVLKEGFDVEFLKRHFQDPTGNLYDGGFCQEIDADLEKDEGKGPGDRSDLRELVAACQESDPKIRKTRVAKILDVDAFLTFMAFEVMSCHWDGYVANRNNYRIYFDPQTGKARFLLHGMDQMFQDPEFPVFAPFPGLVAQAVRSDDETNERFRERVRKMLPQFAGEHLSQQIEMLHARLRPVIEEMHPEAAAGFDDQIAQLRDRLQNRAQSIARQLTEPDPPPWQTEDGPQVVDPVEPTALEDWEPRDESSQAELSIAEVDNQQILQIAVGDPGDCLASWRKRIGLASGKYRLTARMRTEGVVPLTDDRGTGAGLRISGVPRDNSLTGDSDWQELAYDFELLEEQQEVELVLELRATSGRLLIAQPVLIQRILD